MRAVFKQILVAVARLALGAMLWCGSLRSAAAEPTGFVLDIRPLLKTYCQDCHGEKRQKGEVNLEAFTDEASLYRNPKLWETVLRQLRDGEMPPKKKPQPTPQEMDLLVHWVDGLLAGLDETKIVRNPGHVVLHRLNRTEYNNTVRDLFGVTNRPADAFPADGGGGGGFDNNADTLFLPPILMEQYLAAAAAALDSAADDKVFTAKPGWFTSERGAAQKIIARQAFRAFRRPVSDAETARYLGLYDAAKKRGEPHAAAVRLALSALLVSPNFLFRSIEDRSTDQPFALNDWELASELSYFLWSSMPDEELLKLAARGRLTQPDVLKRQVQRMIKDPRSGALAENFTLQWLGVKSFRTSAPPDPNRFPEFTPSLVEAMLREPVEFFHELLRDNGSLLELIDADHTFANAELAKIYGLPGVTGPEMRRVSLPDRTRGGVLTMAVSLTHTSYPLRTSPVLRGKWVLEEILGTPPPPPPPLVQSLPRDDKPVDGLTLRQRLEKHRSDANCASCHSKLDPLGFGLEQFDPVGRWRTTISDQPVDASGELPGGKKFEGVGGLKSILLEKQDQFVRNLTERMLSYALGRGLEFYDAPSIRRIAKSVAEEKFSASALVTEIVMSYPFKHRKSEPKTVAQVSTPSPDRP
jgi:mono/diheme cytochrome c family protein